MAKLPSLLVGDAALSSVVLFRYHQHMLQTCAAIRKGANVHNRLKEMREYGFELAHVLDVSMSNNFSVKCVQFLEYVVVEIVQLHSNDRHQQPQRIIDGSYNPEKGTAYYFTPHGNQIRQQGKYSIDSTNKNYEDVPSVDEICRKSFHQSLMVALVTCSCGFVLFMVIVMAFISYLVLKAGKIHFHPCLGIYQMCLFKYFMTLHASTVNIV